MNFLASWKKPFDRRPDGIHHFGFKRAHDIGDLHLVVVVGCTRYQNRDNPTTGGWSPIRAAPKWLGSPVVRKFRRIGFIVLGGLCAWLTIQIVFGRDEFARARLMSALVPSDPVEVVLDGYDDGHGGILAIGVVRENRVDDLTLRDLIGYSFEGADVSRRDGTAIPRSPGNVVTPNQRSTTGSVGSKLDGDPLDMPNGYSLRWHGPFWMRNCLWTVETALYSELIAGLNSDTKSMFDNFRGAWGIVVERIVPKDVDRQKSYSADDLVVLYYAYCQAGREFG